MRPVLRVLSRAPDKHIDSALPPPPCVVTLYILPLPHTYGTGLHVRDTDGTWREAGEAEACSRASNTRARARQPSLVTWLLSVRVAREHGGTREAELLTPAPRGQGDTTREGR